MHVCLRVCERVCVRLCVCVSVTHLGVGVEAAVDAHRQDLMCVSVCKYVLFYNGGGFFV